MWLDLSSNYSEAAYKLNKNFVLCFSKSMLCYISILSLFGFSFFLIVCDNFPNPTLKNPLPIRSARDIILYVAFCSIYCLAKNGVLQTGKFWKILVKELKVKSRDNPRIFRSVAAAIIFLHHQGVLVQPNSTPIPLSLIRITELTGPQYILPWSTETITFQKRLLSRFKYALDKLTHFTELSGTRTQDKLRINLVKTWKLLYSYSTIAEGR